MKFSCAAWPKLRLIWAVLAYLVLSILIMGANPFKGETLAPMGMLSKYPGWAAHSFSSPPSHPERSDILDVYLPQWITLKEAIREGDTGLWNPTPSSGSTGILELSRGTLTPSFLVFMAIDEHWLGFYFASLIKLVIAATGTFLFLRLFIGAYSAFFGGAIFALSGFNAAWFHWPHVATAAWIPWLLWACAGWYLHRRKRWILHTVLATAMLLLGGFPVVAAYGLYAAILLATVLSVLFTRDYRDAMKMAALILVAMVAGFLLSAIPLLALSEMLGLIDLRYRQGGTPLHFPGDLMLLLNPFVEGLPRVERTLYVGWIALMLAFLAPVLVRGRTHAISSIALVWYGTILLACSIVVSFGLLPHGLLRAIPAIGNNGWGRIVVIAGLAVAILAAVSAETVITRIRQYKAGHVRALAMTCIATIAGYQVYSQAILFRTFNSVSMANDFFPSTPTLKYVKANLGNTQNVVADKGYLIAGTLGAYGIPEWFAHGFKNEAEKTLLQQLVEDPFRTPTSARFAESAIKLDGDLYARMGIRYVLMAHNKLKFIRSQIPTGEMESLHLSHDRIAQIIRVNIPISLSAIGIRFDTLGAKHVPADVFLEVSDSSGRILAKAVVEAEQIRDKNRTIFKFKENLELLAGAYELHIGLFNNGNNRPLTVQYSHRVRHDGDMIRVNSEIIPGAMLYTLYGSGDPVPFDPDWWRSVDLHEDRITTLENLRTPKGAYLVRDLSAKSPWTENNIITKRNQAERIHVLYSGRSAGYIILPVRLYPGWVVYINGVKGFPESYMGMLPAFKVTGPSDIEFAYEPTYVSTGAVLMECALLLIFISLRLADSCQRSQIKPAEIDT